MGCNQVMALNLASQLDSKLYAFFSVAVSDASHNPINTATVAEHFVSVQHQYSQ